MATLLKTLNNVMLSVLSLLMLFSQFVIAEEPITEAEKLRAASEAYLSQLDGTWVGEISSLELDGDYPDEPYESEFIIRISDDVVEVGTKHEGKWYQMPYEFKMVRFKTHAIIYAFAADKSWVEGFSFLVTLDGINDMKLLWSRAVNNYVLPQAEMEGRGYFQGAALFTRQ